MEFPIDITNILTKELVGKSYRYCTYNMPIMEPYIVRNKKKGVTLKQFNGRKTRVYPPAPCLVPLINRCYCDVNYHFYQKIA